MKYWNTVTGGNGLLAKKFNLVYSCRLGTRVGKTIKTPPRRIFTDTHSKNFNIIKGTTQSGQTVWSSWPGRSTKACWLFREQNWAKTFFEKKNFVTGALPEMCYSDALQEECQLHNTPGQVQIHEPQRVRSCYKLWHQLSEWKNYESSWKSCFDHSCEQPRWPTFWINNIRSKEHFSKKKVIKSFINICEF